MVMNPYESMVQTFGVFIVFFPKTEATSGAFEVAKWLVEVPDGFGDCAVDLVGFGSIEQWRKHCYLLHIGDEFIPSYLGIILNNYEIL